MKAPVIHRVGIIMNGVTGRMGTNQHLLRSIAAIIRQGGVKVGAGEAIMPDPILVGRNPEKLEQLAARAGVNRWTTDFDTALADPRDTVYFDAQATACRTPAVKKAIAAGKHVYCEKPAASTTADAMELYRLAREAGVKHGVVQDKLWLPGMLKLKSLCQSGFLGRILSIRGEFGYWVFEGDRTLAGNASEPPARSASETLARSASEGTLQRPSWNYRKEDGGGIILDMLCHFRYLLDNLFGQVRAVSCLGATHVDRRWDESGRPYPCTADDAAYSAFELEGGIIAQINASWCTRVRRDDLFVLQVDGTKGSAVAGLRDCWVQPYEATPRPVWNPDVDSSIDFYDGWQRVLQQETYNNAFKVQWELFLRHVVKDEPFPWTLREGAKGVQLAEKGIESWQQRQWVNVPELR